MPEAISALHAYAGVGLAFALGLLIGIERGWSHRLDADGSRVAGIRTFALIGLAGGISGEVTAQVSPLAGAALVVATGAALLIGYARAGAPGEVSATTTVVGIITLGLGVLSATGHQVLASVIAAVTTLVLAQRRRLHAWLGRLSEPEMQAIARFGLISLAVLPLLPDRQFGPFDAWNPRQIWTVVVLVSGLSLVGYAASRLLGQAKGILATAAAGALVSSTAVTAALAGRMREHDLDEAGLIAGIALASAVMLSRVMILVALLAPFAFAPLAVVTGPAAAVSALFVALALRGRRVSGDTDAKAPTVRNPFDLAPALLLAGAVMLVSLAARWALQAFGDAGVATVVGISGLVDVDAAIISMSGLPPGSLAPPTAALVLSAAVIANGLVKAGLAVAIARGRAGWRAAAPLLWSVAVGIAGAGAMHAIFR